MIQLVLIQEIETLTKLLIKDNLYKTLCNCSKKEIKFLPGYEWFMILDMKKEEILGIFLITPGIGKTVFFHIGLYKKERGAGSPELIRECMNRYASNKDIIFLAPIPEYNRAAIKVAVKMGLFYKTTIYGGYSNSNLLIFSEV